MLTLDYLLDTITLSLNIESEELDAIADINETWMFGIENKTVEFAPFQMIYYQHIANRKLLILTEIKGYHREYIWS